MVVIGACVAVVISVFLPSRNAVPGIADSNQFTELLLAAMKAMFDLSAALTVGWLVAAVALAPPQKSGIFDVGGYRAMRAASLSAWVWTAVSLAMIPLTMADLNGKSLGQAINANVVIEGIQLFTNVRGYLICAIIAVFIALLSRIVMRPSWAAVLMFAAIVGLLPQALSGHASGSDDHDVAVDTMIFHLVGISLWIGGLLAFLGMVRQNVANLPTVARRYSSLALVAFVAVAISGIANAWIRLTYLSDLWTTAYGRLVVVKALALITLGIFGYAQRQRSLPAIAKGKRRPLIRLASVELLIMGATVGVAAALGRTAPPAAQRSAPERPERLRRADSRVPAVRAADRRETAVRLAIRLPARNRGPRGGRAVPRRSASAAQTGRRLAAGSHLGLDAGLPDDPARDVVRAGTLRRDAVLAAHDRPHDARHDRPDPAGPRARRSPWRCGRCQ